MYASVNKVRTNTTPQGVCHCHPGSEEQGQSGTREEDDEEEVVVVVV
jgi:hypothetical protein